MIGPKDMQASKPKEPRRYTGWSYEDRKCPKHKVKLVKDDHECCGCCCSGCDPEWTCPECEELYDLAYRAWFKSWGHYVAFGDHLLVRDGKLLSMSGVSVQLFLHGGKPLKAGQWCKVGDDGYLKLARKPWTPNMLVIG